jgi:hypothetical protein
VRPESGLGDFILLSFAASYSANAEGREKFSLVCDKGDAKVNSSVLISHIHRPTECADPAEVYARPGTVRTEPLKNLNCDIIAARRRT